MGRFFLALPPPPPPFHPPCSLFSLPLVWIAFALDGIAITKKGKGTPFIPLSRRSGVIANWGDHAALKEILVVSVFSLFAWWDEGRKE